MAADLQKFNSLFTELETEVVTLDKQVVGLRQELVTLEARKQLVLRQTAEIVQQQHDQTDVHRALVTDRTEEIQRLETAIARQTVAYKTAEEELQFAVSELQTVRTESEKVVNELNNTVDGIKAEIQQLEANKVTVAEELAASQEELRASHEAAKVLDEQVKLKAKEVADAATQADQDITIITQHVTDVTKLLDDKQDALEELEATIVTKQADITDLQKKHDTFVAYEERGRKALEAREAALLANEATLAEARNRARRAGVLDNI